MNRASEFLAAVTISMLATGCSSQDAPKSTGAKSTPVALPSSLMIAENRKHPLAKYLEIVGLRPSESKQGKLTVRFGVVNHSDADIADLGLDVSLRPATAKPEDAPFCSFTVKIPALPPQELVGAKGECATSLRVYELPDWQFIRASYQITSPQP